MGNFTSGINGRRNQLPLNEATTSQAQNRKERFLTWVKRSDVERSSNATATARTSHVDEGDRSRDVLQSPEMKTFELGLEGLEMIYTGQVKTAEGGNKAPQLKRMAALESQGVHATKSVGREGIAILVPRAELARAAQLSAQGGLPRGEHPSFGVLFKKDGLISSPLEERARMMYALSQQLEVMLMDIDGVVSARVNVVLPESRPGRFVEQPSAAVLIRHAAHADADLLQWTVRQLVLNSVPGLAGTDGQRISVAFTASRENDVKTNGIPGIQPTCGGMAAAAGRACATAVTSGWTASTLIAVAAIVTIFAGIGSLAWAHPSMAGLRQRLRAAIAR